MHVQANIILANSFASVVTLALEVAYIHHPREKPVDLDEAISRDQAMNENLNNAGLI